MGHVHVVDGTISSWDNYFTGQVHGTSPAFISTRKPIKFQTTLKTLQVPPKSLGLVTFSLPNRNFKPKIPKNPTPPQINENVLKKMALKNC
jgi:hypothetical protein